MSKDSDKVADEITHYLVDEVGDSTHQLDALVGGEHRKAPLSAESPPNAGARAGVPGGPTGRVSSHGGWGGGN